MAWIQSTQQLSISTSIQYMSHTVQCSPHCMSPAVCSHCSPGMSSYTTSSSPSVPPPLDTAAGCWGAGGDGTSYVPSPTGGPPGGLTS